MKRICLLLAVLLGLGCGRVWAQDAKTVVERYYEVTGLNTDRIYTEPVRIEATTTAMGMELPTTIIMQLPDKMNLEMTMMGMPMKFVMDGTQGWVSVPGQGVQPMPQEQIDQLVQQCRGMTSNMKWDDEIFDFTLLDSVEENGKTYDVVRAVVKENVGLPTEDMVLYFDRATGLLGYSRTAVSEGGQTIALKSVAEEYKTEGELTYPSLTRVYADGKEISVVRIRSFVIGYPVTSATFARPQ